DSNDKIKTVVIDGTLKIYVDNGYWNKWNWGSNVKMKAYVTVKDLTKLNISGASRTTITDKISVNDLKIVLSGASSLKGDIAA
ncbi:GIN domain-containing protein, partial [Vibrio parahaemolyticus]